MKRVALLLLMAAVSRAQIYSPRIVAKGQVESWDAATLARGIYTQAGAMTPREKAEAIWRFFLTDGRFVKPGFWYHIAGWAYEEPGGEVLDPVKLLNSYGFGLCYHIAPLLEAVYSAGGFEEARVWFLTGHTVAEVFYDGAYHYFDSDMMGYNAIGEGNPRALPVASVHQIELDGGIILGKMKAPRDVDAQRVDYPWYPADVREAAIDGLAELFTTTKDNRLFPFTRHADGHSMEFTLRPGERLIRYFHPEKPGLFYLPYERTEKGWEEFPREIEQYHIRTADGPRSQKDDRYWSTGRIEYTPNLSDPRAYESMDQSEAVFRVISPYVIIDAEFSLELELKSKAQAIDVATSTDGGKIWEPAGAVTGPVHGPWRITPRTLARSPHGTLEAVGGHYGYLLRVHRRPEQVKQITIVTRFQMNPRTLPALTHGANGLIYHAGPREERWPAAISLERVEQFARSVHNIQYISEAAQGFLAPRNNGEPAEVTFELSASGAAISAFEAGGRFLDIHDGEVPDKFTAEVRKTAYESVVPPAGRRAWLEWSLSPAGPYRELWHYDRDLKWKDGTPIDRTLRWPEVFRQMRSVPDGAHRIYVRYRLNGVALDNVRLIAISTPGGQSPVVEVTHLWHEGAQARSHLERIADPWREHRYEVRTGTGAGITNDALILFCPQSAPR